VAIPTWNSTSGHNFMSKSCPVKSYYLPYIKKIYSTTWKFNGSEKLFPPETVFPKWVQFTSLFTVSFGMFTALLIRISTSLAVMCGDTCWGGLFYFLILFVNASAKIKCLYKQLCIVLWETGFCWNYFFLFPSQKVAQSFCYKTSP